MSQNLRYGHNYRKISILIKIVENSWFWSNFTKMSILVMIKENFDFSQNFQNLSKISILVKKNRKITILVNIFEKCRF